jgi:translocation and assembly module TamB
MRGALKVLLLLSLLLALILATLPWWLGAILRPVARSQGASFERYELLGYTRFRLEGVKLERPGLAFSAARATLDTPLLWLLRRPHAHAEISDWSLRLIPADSPRPTPSNPSSPATVHAQTQRVTAQLRRWLPRLTAENGTISRGEQTWRLAHVSWRDGAVHATGALPTRQELQATVAEKGDTLLATLELPALTTRAELVWTPRAIRGHGTWQHQPFVIEARFDDAAWIPSHAELRAENWDLPAAQVQLGPTYERVRGHVLARWTGREFTADLRVNASPAPGKKSPPFELSAHATGDRRAIVLRTLHVRAPFATATLSAPLTFSLENRTAATPAVLTVNADLGQQPWFDAAGRLTGEIRTAPHAGDSRGEFDVTVEAFRWSKFTAPSAHVRGRWQAPRVQLDEALVTLDAGSRIIAHGSFDWKTRELHDARIDATLASTWIAPLLREQAAVERVVAAVELDGPLAAPRHRGEIDVTQLRASRLRPLDAHAQWTGEGRVLPEFSASVRAGNAGLQLSGTLDAVRATVREFALQRGGQPLLRSVAPAEISRTPHWKISGLRLEGPEQSLAVDAEWSEAPHFFVSAHNVASEWLADWWTDAVLPLRIAALTVRGGPRGDFLAADAAIDASVQIDGTWLQGRIGATAEAEGVRVSQLEFTDAHGLMAYASGRIPARVRWSRTPRLELDARAPLELEASIAPDSPLWELVRRRTGMAIEGGAVVASVSGSLEQPRGLVRVEATRVAREGTEKNELTALSATLRGQRDGVQLESLAAQVAGHPVRATGRLPMNDDAWRALLSSPGEFDWRRAEVQLSAPRVELAALAPTFPAGPFTGGTLAAELQLAGGQVTGSAQLRGGASRPLPGLGRLLEIEADLALAGRRLEVRTFSARLGGEPVELTGSAALGDRNRLDLDLRLQAKNVPLVRRPGLLVRTDFDLRAQTPDRGPTRISGRVDLRDALVLADLAAILPGGPRGGSRPPPYFSINADPFSRWPLDVQIGGHRAVRVRTAVFNGIATPQFHLTGTLGDPRAIGQLSVDSGQVLFPFARFAVQQGTVRITAADPTQLQLAVNANAKRMGYELRLEAGGTTAAPTLAFSSNPPLESADILLLVTTGQPPKNESLAGVGPTDQQRLTRLGTFLGSGIFQNFSGTEDRLEFTSGEQVSESGRETYRAEYKLTEKFSLTGEYDQYDDYNAGLSYRIYTKEGTKRDERKK